jgi:hypothetical protein
MRVRPTRLRPPARSKLLKALSHAWAPSTRSPRRALASTVLRRAPRKRSSTTRSPPTRASSRRQRPCSRTPTRPTTQKPTRPSNRRQPRSPASPSSSVSSPAARRGRQNRLPTSRRLRVTWPVPSAPTSPALLGSERPAGSLARRWPRPWAASADPPPSAVLPRSLSTTPSRRPRRTRIRGPRAWPGNCRRCKLLQCLSASDPRSRRSMC